MVQLVEEFFQKYGIYTFIAVMTLLGFFNGLKKPIKKYYLVSVSYTHLTLPTT